VRWRNAGLHRHHARCGTGASSRSTRCRDEGRRVTPDYISALRAAGIKFDSARNITELRAVGVTGDTPAQMRTAGFGNLTTKQLVEMRAMGVSPRTSNSSPTPEYKNLTPHEIVELRAQGINPEFIKSLTKRLHQPLRQGPGPDGSDGRERRVHSAIWPSTK